MYEQGKIINLEAFKEALLARYLIAKIRMGMVAMR